MRPKSGLGAATRPRSRSRVTTSPSAHHKRSEHLRENPSQSHSIPAYIALFRGSLALSGYVDPGYKISIYRINCADYGVPQVRQRVIIVGIRSDLGTEFTAPKPIRQPPSMGDSSVEVPNWIKQIVKDDSSDEGCFPSWMSVKEAVDDLWSPSGTAESGVADQDKLTHATIVLGKRKRRDRQLRADLPSPTIRAQHHGHIEVHYSRQQDGSLRRLTIRECARIQGFPDSFEFPTSATQAYIQIGNAMPPVVVHYWAEAIVRWLSKLELPASEDLGGSDGER